MECIDIYKGECPITYDEACNLEPWRTVNADLAAPNDGGLSAWFIHWSDIAIVLRDPNALPPTRWQRLKRRGRAWRYRTAEAWWETRYRVRTASALLRDALRVLFCG